MRRLFWMSVGAGLGISGYRRANRVIRELSWQPRSGPTRLRRSGLRQLRGVAGFVRDVREGMDLYAERQQLGVEPHRTPDGPEGPTLGWQNVNGAEASHSASHRARHSASRGASHNGASAH